MALTADEIEVLGKLTEQGKLQGELRVQVRNSDEMAREFIAAHKEARLNIAKSEETNVEQYLAELKAEIELWERV